MIKIPENKTVYFDVDNTLIMDVCDTDPDADNEDIAFPAGLDDNYRELVKAHDSHIELLMRFKAMGYTIVVWSQTGSDWAEHIVDILGIKDWVDLVIDKPMFYVDDLPCEFWMKNRIYKEPT